MDKQTQQNKICSVILPVYNSERYLSRTVTSVLQQTMGDFELLAINDENLKNRGHFQRSDMRNYNMM